MKNILICGAGRSASDLITYMLQHAEENDWDVTVGDISVETAEKKIGGHPRGKAVFFDCFDDEVMTKYIKDADIVIVSENPADDIRNAREIAWVIKHGAVVRSPDDCSVIHPPVAGTCQ